MRKVAQVFEHSSLAIGEQGLTGRHFDALVLYNERQGGRFFSVGHRRLYFGSYVGVIQVGDLAIEILPKIDRSAVEDKGKWQRVLLCMLRQAGFLDVEVAPNANLHLSHSPLLDIYLREFLQETNRLVHGGLVKKYRVQECNIHKLKGRILFRKHIARNLLHKERLYTAHQVYDSNNVFNRILKHALEIVQGMAIQPALIAQANHLGLAFEPFDNQRVTSELFERLCYDRHTENYRKAIQLARLIILNYTPDLRNGQEHVLAILFDMNELFEKFVFVQLKKAAQVYSAEDVLVEGQCRRAFWGSKSIRPDILVSYRDAGVMHRTVLDTKWKIPKDDLPNDADLKQMYAYNLHFDCKSSVLLYPRASKLQEKGGNIFEHSMSLPSEYSHDCRTYFINMFDENHELRRDVGKQVLNEQILPVDIQRRFVTP